jgi:hypothetical protein
MISKFSSGIGDRLASAEESKHYCNPVFRISQKYKGKIGTSFKLFYGSG